MSLRRQLEQEISLPSGQVNVLRSLALLDQLLVNTSDKEALALGEEFLPRIVQAHAEKATHFLERLLQPDPQQDDPPFQLEWLYPFMRRFQSLDISHLLGRRENNYPEERQAVAFVELTAEEREAYIREPVVIAHAEDIAGWAEQIRAALRDTASFPQLLMWTQLSPAELTLGVLLGGFEVQQQGDFYEPAGIQISLFPTAANNKC